MRHAYQVILTLGLLATACGRQQDDTSSLDASPAQQKQTDQAYWNDERGFLVGSLVQLCAMDPAAPNEVLIAQLHENYVKRYKAERQAGKNPGPAHTAARSQIHTNLAKNCANQTPAAQAVVTAQTPAGFVTALYQKVIGIDPNPKGAIFLRFVQQRRDGAPRDALVAGILSIPEFCVRHAYFGRLGKQMPESRVNFHVKDMATHGKSCAVKDGEIKANVQKCKKNGSC